jgi:hypothetical protein
LEALSVGAGAGGDAERKAALQAAEPPETDENAEAGADAGADTGGKFNSVTDVDKVWRLGCDRRGVDGGGHFGI